MIDIAEARRRYQTDAEFHHLVDLLVRSITTLHMSPGEMRQTAVFAEIVFRERTPIGFPFQL